MVNLIGIHGKLQHGKDTVFGIIQELTGHSFVNKKFAYKLKAMTAILVGCHVDQLEDIEFKNKPLGEEWRRWFIADNGIRHDGMFKDMRVPEYFVNEVDAIKACDLAHYIDSEVLSPRMILQLLGTEGGRELLHPNVWVNALFADFKPESKWIITDVRFPNEADRVRKEGGLLLKVVRDGIPSNDTHLSETALDNYSQWDAIVYNNGTKEDLYNSVKSMLNHYKIV